MFALTLALTHLLCRIDLYEIKSARLRPTLRGLCGSGHAASGRSLRRSPASAGIPRGQTGDVNRPVRSVIAWLGRSYVSENG
jgi:hypothetical protein